MSPPQVNLAVKETPTVSEEELPMEKKEKIEMPAIVTMETEQIRIQRANFEARRRRRVACCMSLIVIVLVAAAASVILAVRHRHYNHRHHHHHRDSWTCNVGEQNINEHVRVDHDNQLIHVHHQHMPTMSTTTTTTDYFEADDNQAVSATNNNNNKLPTTHILHEYGRRMAAYKDEDMNVCYITRLDESFDEGYARWEKYESTGRDPKTLRVFNNHPVEMLVLRHVTDVHIYAHCHNSVSYWAVEIEKEEITSSMTIVRL